MRKSRRIPLSSWTDRGLHATAARFQRISCNEGLSRAQDWLFTSILNELAWRYENRPKVALVPDGEDWRCFGCDLCRPEPGQVVGQYRILYVPPNG